MNGQRIVQRLAPWGLPLLLLAVWQLSVSCLLYTSDAADE